ncbi:hypothetical protein V5N11_018750 [Cardamine amara subsp. amara]|uniref:Uncharacterized protein n=1 Tax=Cardamine amara subsp. amara TaxID=228776 RepID=A0ABD1BDE7_CARAN
MLQQILHGQANGAIEQTKMMADLKNHIDCSYANLNTKFETLISRLKYLEGLSASSSNKSSGQLPGKAVQNPKDSAPELYLPFKKRYAAFTEDSDTQAGEDFAQKSVEE